jgi:hypothetical protein
MIQGLGKTEVRSQAIREQEMGNRQKGRGTACCSWFEISGRRSIMGVSSVS